ncbi:MAG: hypothetical protein AB1468_04315, partial [Candidatus Micrarchaeota archaeon]
PPPGDTVPIDDAGFKEGMKVLLKAETIAIFRIKKENAGGEPSTWATGWHARLEVTSGDLGLQGGDEIKKWVLETATIGGKPMFARLAEAVEALQNVAWFRIVLNETGEVGFETSAF